MMRFKLTDGSIRDVDPGHIISTSPYQERVPSTRLHEFFGILDQVEYDYDRCTIKLIDGSTIHAEQDYYETQAAVQEAKEESIT